jgi:hypothetical protein
MRRTDNSQRPRRNLNLHAHSNRLRTTVGRARLGTVMQLLAAIIACTFGLVPSTIGATPEAPAAPKRLSSSFDFSYVVRVSPPPHAHNVRVWIPLPSTNEFQTISELQLEAPANVRMHNEKNGNQYAYFTVNSSRAQSPFEIRVTFHVVRYERHLDLASLVDPPGPFPKDVAAFLQPDTLAPLDGALANVARERTQGLANPLEKARSLYEYVVSTVGFAPESTGVCREDAPVASHSKDGNCADSDSLFIAMAQAVGIPARLETGFLLPEGQKEGIVGGYHSWAEFYANGIGWIPVDSWQASRDPNKRDVFFGAIDANRVMISTGRELSGVDAPKVGRSNFMAGPYIEMDGKPSPNYSVDFFFYEAKLTSTLRPVVRRPICAGGGWLASGRIPRLPS